MTAIAGIVSFDKKPVDPGIIERMKDTMVPYGRDAQHVWCEPGAGLVRTLCCITPEDSMDQQPLRSADENLMMVFDGRIDNRDELTMRLGISNRQARLMADSAFVLKAFERWGERSLEYLLGDFAFAVWNRSACSLFLARDPMGNRPLYWHKTNHFFAFATLSKGLFAVPGIPRQLCEERIADYLALLPMKGPESFYKDIYRIEPGHRLVLEDGRVQTHRYHRFDPEHRIIFKTDDDYVDNARELLLQAVKCRLRTTGNIASHLSSGLDSSTVTASAAQLLQKKGKRLLAYTAVPRKGFTGPVPKGRHADEGPAASALADRFSNIEHILFRPGNRTPVENLELKVENLDRPPLNLCNQVWLEGIREDAARRGAKVLLTGTMGNMTISYDGRPRLANLLKRGQCLEWLREVHSMVRQTDTPLRGAVVSSLGPFLPAPFWRAFKTWKSRGWTNLHDYTAIHPDLIRRTNLYDRARDSGWDLNYRPWTDGWQMRTAVLYRMDPGDFFTGCIGANNIEMRDPTSDLRLVKFCLGIPEDQYFKNGRSKLLLHRLMNHILPPEILHAKTKGLQAADWYEGETAARDEIKTWLKRLESTSEAPRYLDLRRMRTLLENWPLDGWNQDITIKTYRLLLLRGLSVGAFIHYVEGCNR
ncbi:MAG TPA: hypothetical protein DHV36_06535 [Desulfobacteraceae bacterium]|nr:hypothetical protein [Desulfobacteraceae bacterium]